jgi:peptide/nickel transport system substrate-binding protein
MASKSVLRAAAALLALALAAGTADARTVRWARSGDALTLDPHAQNEGPTHNLLQQIYEPLIIRDLSGKLVPTLATSWRVTEDPTVWEFKLRQGVKFHNGNTFNADDVVFSLERALQPTSDLKPDQLHRQGGASRRPHGAYQDQGSQSLVPAYLITST